MEMRKRRMVRIPNSDGEEKVRRMNPDSSAGIYVTASVEAQCRFIAQNRKIKGRRISRTQSIYLCVIDLLLLFHVPVPSNQSTLSFH